MQSARGGEGVQKCGAVPRRARIEGSYIVVSLNSRLESNKEQEEEGCVRSRTYRIGEEGLVEGGNPNPLKNHSKSSGKPGGQRHKWPVRERTGLEMRVW